MPNEPSEDSRVDGGRPAPNDPDPTQPIAPDGTPVPVDDDGHVLPPTDEQLGRDER